VIGGIPRAFAPVKLHRSSRTLIPRSIWNDYAIRSFPSARSAKWKPAHRKHNRTRRATDPLCGLRAKRILENTQRFALLLQRQGYRLSTLSRIQRVQVGFCRTKCASSRSWRLSARRPSVASACGRPRCSVRASDSIRYPGRPQLASVARC
jgi:hypothetical protein